MRIYENVYEFPTEYGMIFYAHVKVDKIYTDCIRISDYIGNQIIIENPNKLKLEINNCYVVIFKCNRDLQQQYPVYPNIFVRAIYNTTTKQILLWKDQ